MLMKTGFDAGGLKGFLIDGIPDRALAIIVVLFLGIGSSHKM
jgi:hypothetical protein